MSDSNEALSEVAWSLEQQAKTVWKIPLRENQVAQALQEPMMELAKLRWVRDHGNDGIIEVDIYETPLGWTLVGDSPVLKVEAEISGVSRKYLPVAAGALVKDAIKAGLSADQVIEAIRLEFVKQTVTG